jgi:hypothetical protein
MVAHDSLSVTLSRSLDGIPKESGPSARRIFGDRRAFIASAHRIAQRLTTMKVVIEKKKLAAHVKLITSDEIKVI